MSQLVHIVGYDIAIKSVNLYMLDLAQAHFIIFMLNVCIYYILCILYVIYTHTTFMCVF